MPTKNYYSSILSALVLYTGLVSSAFGQSNTCATATVANLGANAGTAVGATNDGASTCGLAGGRDVYYRFTPTVTGTYQLSLCQDDIFWDTVLSVHTGCPATAANTLACDDDGCGFVAELSVIETIALTANVPYTIRIAGYAAGTTPSSIILNINSQISGACCDGPCCLLSTATSCIGVFQGANTICTPMLCGTTGANDDCAGAIDFLNVTGISTTGSTFLACTTVGSGAGCGGGGVNDVWYRFRPSVTASYTANLCLSNTAWDSVISVHTACPGTAGNQIAGACNDDNCTGDIGLSAITTTFSLTAGTDYYIRVAGYINSNFAPNRGDFQLTVTSEPLGSCCAPAGTCSVTPAASCISPNVWTSGAACAPNNCPQPIGACCDTNTGACTSVTAPNCFDTFQGVGTLCVPNSCAQPSGACCTGGGLCVATLGSGACAGTFQGAGTTCTPNFCPPPPANDLCSGATVASIGANAGTLIGSSSDGFNTCEGGGGIDVYYSFTPPATGTYEVSLCQDNVLFDSILSVHTGCPADGSNEIGCDDDGCGFIFDLSTIATIQLTAGLPNPYIIRVSTFDGATAGDSFILNINPVASGACCLLDGSCEVSTANGCLGSFQGDNSVCAPNPCPQPGACCSAAGCCTSTLQTNCAATFQGVGTVCTPNPCGAVPANDSCNGAVALTLGAPVTGSTCLATSNEPGVGGSCATGGLANVYRGLWFSFTPSSTAAYRVSACGSGHDTVLSIQTSANCLNFVELVGGCDDDTCDGLNPAGSGLASDITSIVLTAGTNYYILLQSWGGGAEPIGGTFALVVTSVGTLGACCNASTCTQTDAANCAFVFTAGNVCSPNSCAPATGACCCGASCTVTTSAACPTGPGTNATYSAGGVCTPFSLTVPCCRSDYNKSGGVPSVQDIFDFLSGYFAASPCADTNDLGGISVQDIFDFLSAYFGGC